MNILFFIGNGFDLNLDMKTKYRHFYDHYISLKSPNQLVQKLKDEIDENLENWSDLELALGEYTKSLNSTEEFNQVFEDIEDNLADYLESEERLFEFEQFDGAKLYKYFVSPENSLPTADKNKIKGFKQKWSNSQWNINLITFNYTRTLEKLIGYSGSPIPINDFVNRKNYPIILQKVEHIHGYTSERMVMGVNDVSQVSNVDFHSNEDVIETLVKSECNQAQKHTIDNWCKNQIIDANLICIFGSSIGDTDNLWWQLIGEQLKRECLLIIFEKGEKIPPRRPQKGKIAERQKKQYFLSKTKLNSKEKEEAGKKIFIGVNTSIFNKEEIEKPVASSV